MGMFLFKFNCTRRDYQNKMTKWEFVQTKAYIFHINIKLCIATNYSTLIVNSTKSRLYLIQTTIKYSISQEYFIQCLFIFGLHPIFTKLIEGRIFMRLQPFL